MKTNQQLSVHCGKANDSFEHLKMLCEQEAQKLKIDIPVGETVQVPFWTASIPSEVIGVGFFRKDEQGNIVYKLDFSETTL